MLARPGSFDPKLRKNCIPNRMHTYIQRAVWEPLPLVVEKLTAFPFELSISSRHWDSVT
jgi:hypothetical protein